MFGYKFTTSKSYDSHLLHILLVRPRIEDINAMHSKEASMLYKFTTKYIHFFCTSIDFSNKTDFKTQSIHKMLMNVKVAEHCDFLLFVAVKNFRILFE